MEQWRNIDGYDGLYQVSNEGRVRSLGNGNSNNSKEKILKPGTNKDGYQYVILYKNKEKKYYRVHRLVADTFIPNPLNLPIINHKDENPSNNRVDNLEWCNNKYNITYSKGRVVFSVNIKTNEITYYQSIRNASSITNIPPGDICNCCKGKLNTAGGYKWYYMN